MSSRGFSNSTEPLGTEVGEIPPTPVKTLQIPPITSLLAFQPAELPTLLIRRRVRSGAVDSGEQGDSFVALEIVIKDDQSSI